MKPSQLSLALFCLLIGAFARAEPYQILTEEWAPYNYQQGDQLTGMATDIVRAIMTLTGDGFEILVVPSMRATHGLMNRPRTIMYSLFRTPEREALFKWVGPIAEESIYPYQLASTPTPVDSLDQLRHAPKLEFIYDQQIENADKLTRLIDGAVKSDHRDSGSGDPE